jgi:hypothetical protein
MFKPHRCKRKSCGFRILSQHNFKLHCNQQVRNVTPINSTPWFYALVPFTCTTTFKITVTLSHSCFSLVLLTLKNERNPIDQGSSSNHSNRKNNHNENMQSQPGHNMPCVNVNTHNDRDNNNHDKSMTTSPTPKARSNRHEATPSLVSLDSYGVFPSCASDIDMLEDAAAVASYHGDDGDHGVGVGVGVDRGVGAGVGVGVATGGTTASAASTVATSAGPNHYYEPMDDLDLMLQHQDFAQLVTLAVKVKQARLQVAEACAAGANGTGAAAGAGKTRQASTALEPSEVIAAVSRLQDQLLAAGPNVNSNGSINNSTCRQLIPRGVYPITDSIMDDSLETLQNEVDRCHRCLEQQEKYGGATRNAMTTTEPTTAVTATNAGGTTNLTKAQKKRGRGKKEAIAVKYSKWQTDILMNWMIENKDQPFPDQDEIKNLMRMTGLSNSQVVNWTTNVRKRNRKATCQGGKKPHHFIDFLFLAQDRENRQKKHEKEQKQHQQVRAIKVESNDDALTPYAAPSYHQQQSQQHRPQQRRQQKQQQPQQRQRQHQEAYPSPKQLQSSSVQQSQDDQHQEAYPSPKQLQSSSVAYPSPKQLQSSSVYTAPEAYPSPKQLQSSDLHQFPAPTDMEYHYHSHYRSSGHPGSPSYARNKPSESLQTYGNDWEHAPSLQKVHSIGGSGSALEPLLIDDMSEVVLLDDFSSFWLEDKPNPNHGNNATTFKSNSDNDSMDVLEYHQHRHHYTTAPDVHVQPLLPSVTDDQDAAAMPDYPRSNKPMRVMAVDHVNLDELDDMKIEDINDWAADLGFVVEI